MVRGIVIPADSHQPVEERGFATLDDYQSAVGGWLEAVDLPTLGATMFVNEEGRLQQLPFNSRATFLWWYYVAEARQEPMLAGDVVLVGSADQNGAPGDLPHEVRDLLLGAASYRVEVKTVGDPKWYRNEMIYDDYFEALVWAMLTLERRSAAEDVRVVPTPDIELAGNDSPPPAA